MPTGPFTVGTTSARVVDESRTDPLAPEPGPRELMTQYWYPARTTDGHQRAPYMTPQAAESNEQAVFRLPPGAIVGAESHAYLDAPVRPAEESYPVVLYAHGLMGNRTNNTATAEDLASHGYVVVAMDSTHESTEVEFPDGRLVTGDADNVLEFGLEAIAALRVEDTTFLLDELAAGRHPGALEGALDLERVGMFGHSMGGAAAAGSMHADDRIDASVDLDGFIMGPVGEEGLDRPFLLMGVEGHSPESDPTWAPFLPALEGWHQLLQVTGTGHYMFTDYGSTAREWGLEEQVPPEAWSANFGDIDGQRGVEIHRTYTRAFFDRFLRGEDPELLRGPSADWPEVEFMLPVE